LGGLVGCLAFLVVGLLPATPAVGTPASKQGPIAAPSVEVATPWVVGFSVGFYAFQNQSDYAQPTVTVDHGGLHLEGRYNYEAQGTASLWVGWNLQWGKKLTLALTPMLGGVFGKLNGIAPGLEWSLDWWLLELDSQSELVIDVEDLEKSDFYTWSELRFRPVRWLFAGAALQRTKAHSLAETLAWGPLLGVSFWKITVEGYWFNPGQGESQYGVVSATVSF
jgi:hypothetical protein